jgi:CelD/BcsL family acetyltransferase involved in cellulose biosynthesis
VTLEAEDVDAYLKSRSSNFRQQMRRARRKLEKEGAVFRTAATPEEIDRDLDAFERLHNARWEHRGGSAALVEGVDAMLRQAGRDLLEGGRLRLDSIDVGGRTVSSQLYLAAGGEVTYWLGGFDDDFGSYKPALVALVEAIADSLRRGDDRFDLGPGDQDYKYRLADGKEELAWVTLVPPGPAHLLGRAALAPTQARRALAARLPEDARERVKKLLRR